MKILILGGTGAIGGYLVKILSNAGHNVIVTSRMKRKSYNNFVSYVQGNAHDVAFLTKILDEPFDAIVDFMIYGTSEFRKNINMLLSVTKQYVFLSSSRVYADSDESIVEDSPKLLDSSTDMAFLETDEYSLAKARQENILKNSGQKNWTIIRPYITYGKMRLQLGVLEKEKWLYRALQGRTIVFPKYIADKYTTLTYGIDVSTAISKIIGSANCLGECYHITSPKAIKWIDVLSIYLNTIYEKTGKRPKFLIVYDTNCDQQSVANYQVCYDRLYNRRFNNNKIGNFVDVSKFTDPYYGLRLCLEQFLASPHFSQIDFVLEAEYDRMTKERTPIRNIPGLKQKTTYILHRYLPNIHHFIHQFIN